MMEKTDAVVKRINELARKIAAKRGQDGRSVFLICPRETGEIRVLLSKRIVTERLSSGEEEAFYKAIEQSLKKYSPDKGDFMSFFSTIFKNRRIDEYRKPKNKEELNVLLSEPVGDEETGTQGELGDMIADKSADVEENVISQIDFENNCRLIAAICIEQKRAYSKSPKVCYPPFFFTNNIVYDVFNTNAFDDVVRNNANKFDEAVSGDFLNTLLTGICSSVADISNFECRPLSDFTGKPKDDETPCCNNWFLNCGVLNYYLKKALNKDISPAAFTGQKNKYVTLIGDKLGIKKRA